jgi:hypothetical protein
MVTEQDLQQERKNINRLKQVQRSYMEKRATRYAGLKEKIELKKLINELSKDVWDDEID